MAPAWTDAAADHEQKALLAPPEATLRLDARAPSAVARERTAVSADFERETLAVALHDRATGEALFDYEVWTRTAGAIDTFTLTPLRTDAVGRIQLNARRLGFSELPAFVWLELRDHSTNSHRSPRSGRRYVEVERAADGTPALARIEVSVGPTVAFELELPSGLSAEDLDVSLHWSPPRPEDDSWLEQSAELREPISFGPHPGKLWVRFGEPTKISDSAWVELRSEDNRWRGGAWLHALVGVVDKPLTVELESATRVHGRFTWPADASERYGLDLRLAQVRGGAPEPSVISKFTGNDGRFAFEFVPPGRYRLWTADRNWRPFEYEFDVHAGENDIGVHALTPRRVVGAVRGVIRSSSGRFDGACHVSLSDAALSHDAPYDSSLDFEPRVEGDPASELVAHFEFEDVTEGEWFLYVHCHDGFQFPQSVMRVRAPADDIEILLDDPAMDVRIEIVESESGRDCEDVEFAWSCGGEHDVARGGGVELMLTRLPAAPERLAWRASAPGRQLALGTGLDFERTTRTDGTLELRGRIALEPGFGRRVCVRERGGETPVAGVEVFCDGELAGVTAQDGTVVLRRVDAPERITLRKSGWFQCSTTDLDARSGRYSSDGELYADMAPERP